MTRLVIQHLKPWLIQKGPARVPCQKRLFATSRLCRSEQPTRNPVRDFPWLRSMDPPRIKDYPYATNSEMSFVLNVLPRSIQHAMSKWFADYMLKSLTPQNYFPEEFLLGATFASRRALSVLSQYISHPQDSTYAELERMFNPELLERFTQHFKDTRYRVSVTLPQIYDANLADIWVTLGPSRAFNPNSQYEVAQWMTFTFCLRQSMPNFDNETFAEYRNRMKEDFQQGLRFKVDVVIDADVVYKVEDKENGEICLYDQGRRDLLVQFETPYFEPAHEMVSRDPDTRDIVMDWSWRISDIDHLLERERLDRQEDGSSSEN